MDSSSPGQGRGLGVWLEERCKKEGWSLRQAATKTGLSHTTLYEIINGSRVSAGTVIKLAQAFSGSGDHHRGVVEDELLMLAGYRTRRPEGWELSQPLAQLLDAASRLTERQTRLLISLAEFLAEIPVKGRGKRGTGRNDAASFLKKEGR